jgi:hypothetical protein
LKAIPMCVVETSKSTEGSPVFEERQSKMPSALL